MLTIHQTTDYDKFKLIDRNREVNPKYLINSIDKNNLLETHPIICNDKFEVIDGQNRLAAAKFLEVPIYYIIDKRLKVGDIPTCQVQNPWKMEDFLKYYKEENENYLFIYEILKKHPYPLHFIVRACSSDHGEDYKRFRNGLYKIKKDPKKIEQNLSYLDEIKELVNLTSKCFPDKKIKLTLNALYALWEIFNSEKYDHKTFIRKINTFRENVLNCLKFRDKTMIKEALINQVYNFRSGDKSKLDL